MSKQIDRWIPAILAVLCALVLGGAVTGMVYRYGGTHYYMRIHRTSGSYPISLPVSVSATGYVYKGVAINAQGHRRHLTVKTVAAAPQPFKKGQVVRITVNPHYGVTNYKALKPGQIPANVHVAR